MTVNGVGHAPAQAHHPDPDQLTLDSQLSELTRVTGWVDGLAARYPLSSKVVFAMRLCLEEALSNVVRHGGKVSRITVRFHVRPENLFELIVEDDAPHFNPLDLPPQPPIGPNPASSGGQGLRLMRSFADSLAYAATATGNELRLRFSNPATGPG